jgi:integrase
MARVRDLWFSEVKDAEGNLVKRKTTRHPDRGGNKDAKRWQAVWIGPDGREATKTFHRKVDAKTHGDDQEADIRRGNYVAPADGKTRFGECFSGWLATREDPATVIKYSSLYRLHIAPVFGAREIGSIRPSEVNTLIKGLKDRFEGTATAEGVYAVLNAVLSVAREDNLIVKNPVRTKTVERPKREDRKVMAWPDEVVHAIIDAHPEHLRAMPVLGAGCGMRAGEWFGLAREDLDFEKQIIHVRRQVKKLGREFVFAKPKNDREREVPMGDWVAGYLAKHIECFPPEPYVLPWERAGGPERAHKILFRWHTDNRHVRQANYDYSVWKPALVKAGVLLEPQRDEHRHRRYITTRHEGTHQLRHYYASVTLTDGVNINELAEYLGHHDPAFTLRQYVHLLPNSFDRARAAIDRRMSGRTEAEL